MEENHRRMLVIANPIAGRGQAASSMGTIADGLRRRGLVVETAFTAANGGCEPLVSSVGRVDAVVAVGGDGTVNAVVRGILSKAAERSAGDLPAVGVVPFGTGNVSVLAFGIPKKLERALDVIAAGKIREVDVGIVMRSGKRTDVFLLWLGAGIDAAVMHTVSKNRNGALGIRRLLSFTPAAIRRFLNYPFHGIDVAVDGQPPFRAASVMVANTGHIALVGNIAPHADTGDGFFEVIAASPRSHLGWIPVVLAIRLHRVTACRGIQFQRARRVTLTASDEVPIHIDGDAAGVLPVEIEVRPKAIRLLVP
jgi:diacylglycerol kinase (ATP)